MTRRQRVQRRLERIRHRIARLVTWEKRRDEITRKRRQAYRDARDEYGDDDLRTRRALRRFRRSRKLSQRIDQTEKVLRKRAANKLEWLREHPPPLDPDRDGLIEIDGKHVAAGVGKE